MNQQNLASLLARYPYLYRASPAGETLRLFEFGDGWFGLVDQLSSAIEQAAEKIGLNRSNPERPNIQGMKEKVGKLRVFLVNGNDAMHSLIDEAQERSSHTCEICGAEGMRIRGRQVETRCEAHAPARE